MSNSGRMRSRRKLPRGWSHPIKSSEIAASLPAGGSVTWNGRPQGWQTAEERLVFWMAWSPRTAMPQPVMTVWAVPSRDRAAVRAWIDAVAMPEMQAWVRFLHSAHETWLGSDHMTVWRWRGDSDGTQIGERN